MGLSDDQRRLLKLLAKQDEAYEAIAAATGANVEELKAKAAGAIEALEQDARDEGARAAGPVAVGDPPPPAVAEASSGAVPPTAPPAAEAARPAGARNRSRSQLRSSVKLPGNRRFAELVGGAVVVLLLILFATGAIDIGGDSDDGDGEGGGAAAALSEELPASDSKRATQAVLREVDGSGASGRALFGRLGKQVALVLAARDLDPSPSGSSYAISLVRSPEERIPIAATRVDQSGTISGQFQLPVTVLGALASGYDEMEVSLVVNEELEAALKEVRGSESPPEFGGESVLRGPISGPIVVGEAGSGG